MTGAWIGVIALTLFNLAIFAYLLFHLRMRLGAWRKVLAALPVPMLSFASSYGVYAYNLLFVPPWVAVVMAAAYDVTFSGIPALDIPDPTQRERGKRIALGAAWISFLQGAIAGVFHAVPDLHAYLAAWSMSGRVILYSVGASLHAAQTWVAYHAAAFTLHRSDAPVVNADKPVKSFIARPASMRRDVIAAKMMRYPAPKRVNMAPPDMSGDDPRATEVRRMRAVLTNGRPTPYQKIADSLGLQSRQAAEALDKYGRTHRPR